MRNIINLNKDWKFIQKDAGLPNSLPTDWTSVDLPHTWNAVDGHDGNGSFDRGTYWYAKTFATPKQAFGGNRVFVEILEQDSRRRYMSTEQKLCIMRADIPHSAPTLQISAKRMARIFWSLPAVMSEKRACIRSLQTSRFTEGCTAA